MAGSTVSAALMIFLITQKLLLLPPDTCLEDSPDPHLVRDLSLSEEQHLSTTQLTPTPDYFRLLETGTKVNKADLVLPEWILDTRVNSTPIFRPKF